MQCKLLLQAFASLLWPLPFCFSWTVLKSGMYMGSAGLRGQANSRGQICWVDQWHGWTRAHHCSRLHPCTCAVQVNLETDLNRRRALQRVEELRARDVSIASVRAEALVKEVCRTSGLGWQCRCCCLG